MQTTVIVYDQNTNGKVKIASGKGTFVISIGPDSGFYQGAYVGDGSPFTDPEHNFGPGVFLPPQRWENACDPLTITLKNNEDLYVWRYAGGTLKVHVTEMK